jgi:hypothetical protein
MKPKVIGTLILILLFIIGVITYSLFLGVKAAIGHVTLLYLLVYGVIRVTELIDGD